MSSFKELPEGAAFSAVYQETKDRLLACKLRVSQKSAADQIWEDYGSGKLMAILKKSLLSGLGSEIASHLTMSIGIMKEEYESACDILAGKAAFVPFNFSVKRLSNFNILKQTIFKLSFMSTGIPTMVSHKIETFSFPS